MSADEGGWYVYLLLCNDLSLYCGVTKDMDRRLTEHNEGKGSKYTKSRLPVELWVLSAEMTKSEAHKLEHTVKDKRSTNAKIMVVQRTKGEVPDMLPALKLVELKNPNAEFPTLTFMQQKITNFIHWSRQFDNLVGVRDICDHFGMKSLNGAHHHLVKLRAKGIVDWEDGKALTMRVTERGKRLVPSAVFSHDEGTKQGIRELVERGEKIRGEAELREGREERAVDGLPDPGDLSDVRNEDGPGEA